MRRAADPRHWRDLLTEAAVPHALPYVDSLGRHRSYAATLNALTEAERRLTTVTQTQLGYLAHLAGQTTTATERERRERAARLDQLARSTADGTGERTIHGVRAPHVFWHENGAGPVVVLISGWTASGLVWPSVLIDRLAAQYRVVRIDNRGTGFSRTAPAPYTMANLADDVADVLSAIRVDTATVVGWSLGGMIAQELTLRHPGLVDRLVLVSSRPPAPSHVPGSDAAILAGLARPRAGESLETFYRALWGGYGAPGFAEREPELIDELVEQIMARPTPRATVLHQLRAIAGWYGSGRLARIRAATVVLHGEDDTLTPVENGARMGELIPDARFVPLAGVGHLPPLEAGEELAKIIGGD